MNCKSKMNKLFRLPNLDIDWPWLSISIRNSVPNVRKIYSDTLELELCESILLKHGEVGIHDDKDNLSYRSIVQKKKMFLSQKRICLSVWCKGDPPGLLFFPSRNILRASWNPSSEPFSIGLFL